jgi:DNA-binding CsgD family transcriptional regulator
VKIPPRIVYKNWLPSVPNPEQASPIEQLIMRGEPHVLSDIQRRVFWLVAYGYTSETVSEKVGRTQRTVEHHRYVISTKIPALARVSAYSSLAIEILDVYSSDVRTAEKRLQKQVK